MTPDPQFPRPRIQIYSTRNLGC